MRAIIGDGSLHASQRTVLDHLDAGRSVLAVMATGRGKSLMFQVHAAERALRDRTASLFVYPLRALIADQAFHLNEALEPFGIAVAVLTGESTPRGAPPDVRGARGRLGGHRADHARVPGLPRRRVRAPGRVGFVVVDEAHHIGLARAGQRPAYAAIGQAVERLAAGAREAGRPAPTVLALTATADDGIADAIRGALPLDELVLDETERANLGVDDRRNLKNRDDYLANLVAGGEKTVVYVNSREQSVAGGAHASQAGFRRWRRSFGFYNAGPHAHRARAGGAAVRTDALKVLVATSAFGRGVNIPNIRHVVLYHLPYNEVEFNQMSGRAGRDGRRRAGAPAVRPRRRGNKRAGAARHGRPTTTALPRCTAACAPCSATHGDGFFTLGNVDLAKLASEGGHAVSPQSAACGVAVFRELGLIETHTAYASGENHPLHPRVDTASKVELTDSVRLPRGFGRACHIQRVPRLGDGHRCASLHVRVSRPILPGSAPRRIR